jgi:hypothetical protein
LISAEIIDTSFKRPGELTLQKGLSTTFACENINNNTDKTMKPVLPLITRDTDFTWYIFISSTLLFGNYVQLGTIPYLIMSGGNDKNYEAAVRTARVQAKT